MKTDMRLSINDLSQIGKSPYRRNYRTDGTFNHSTNFLTPSVYVVEGE